MATYSKKDYWMIGSLLFLSLVPTIAGGIRFHQLMTGNGYTVENQRFFNDPIPVLVHILAVLFFSILGAFQFSPGFRKKHIVWHRISGRCLVFMGLVSALSGLWLTLVYPKVSTDGDWLFGIRLAVGIWMFLCIMVGFIFILKRNISKHSHWMIRGYAIGMGAGTQVFTHLPWFIFVGGDPSGVPRDLMMGAGWFINFVFAEWIIRKRNL
ncbi:DUF2306 domain-containing protein [Leptospira sp. 85282-16]|uniref:DUF2306 domain-containing protein n=1 Tax=Leptospira montravelensis TaxID=2484961 RepID=A0ABY2LTH9_9LEPT|nr:MULTISPECIES: DUF2306 domain-containing protein [Leptospira]MCT8335351.1 DUF2306 domain-containing protein [Leptospira sp. 85282-16]TGK78165.1 DUF2306 domain-containing protein [Leptospira montravelensis]TGL03789.1 DUF2306 domain-containing protein [Leptospira montravelensis]